jgi:hypothetical protein
MAKLLSTKGAHRFVLPGQENLPEAARAAYLLRVPGPYARPQIDRAVRAAGARSVGHFQIVAMMERGVREIFDLAGSEGTRERVLADIAAYRKRIEEERDNVKRLKAIMVCGEEIDRCADVLRREYPPYAELEADRDFHWEAWLIETARHAVIGWENLPRAFSADHRGGPDDAALAWLQSARRGDLQAILFEFERLRAPTEEEAKNSVSSSPTGKGPSNSTSAATKPTSRRKARGKKTSGT